MKTIALILLAGLAWSSAAVAGDMVDALPNGPLLRLFGHDQRPLPARFRNHCHRDIWGRFYCSNHCGSDYQFYYCAKDSFGCCHVGMGYCDRDGFLRCRP